MSSRIMSTKHDDTEHDSSGNLSKSYGNTTVAGNASAHLGDVDQSLHLHFHSATSQLTGPAETSPFPLSLPPVSIANPYVRNSGLSERRLSAIVNAIQSGLYFPQAQDRRLDVKEAHEKTFSWVMEKIPDEQPSHLRSWLEMGSGCFWINGKAGSGKSTLMKYIHQHHNTLDLLRSWSADRRLVTANFFFWYAGLPSQKSQQGLLSSILYQILAQEPELAQLLFPEAWSFAAARYDRLGSCDDIAFTMPQLQEACALLKRHLPSNIMVFLLVDGVDEFTGDHLELCKFFKNLTTNKSIKLLVSSRPIPECHKVFSNLPTTLRLQDLTADDIASYVESELLEDELLLDMCFANPNFDKELSAILTEKACGVFLWIVIVVKRLLRALANFDDKQTLMRIIDELPTDLEELYTHMFSRMTKQGQAEGFFILHVMRHITDLSLAHSSLGEFYALQLFIVYQSHHSVTDLRSCTTDEAVSYDYAEEDLRIKHVDGRLRSRCFGLVEVDKKPNVQRDSIVQFLHRTVYEYLCNQEIWEKITDVTTVSLTELSRLLIMSTAHLLQHRKWWPLVRPTPNIASASSVTRFLTQKPQSTSTFSQRLRAQGLDVYSKEQSGSLLASAFLYSTYLEKLEDSTYVDFLEIVESYFLRESYMFEHYVQSCQTVIGSYTTFYYDANILDTFMASSGYRQVSLMLIGSLSLFSYFVRKFDSGTYTTSESSAVLLYILKLVLLACSSNDACASNHADHKCWYTTCVKVVQHVLAGGANANLAYSSSVKEALKLPDYSRTEVLTPWSLWVYKVSTNISIYGSVYRITGFSVEHKMAMAQITYHLLEAGADVRNRNTQVFKFLWIFKVYLVEWREKELDPEVVDVLVKILTHFQMLDDSSIKKA